jgi:hypothetical protein
VITSKIVLLVIILAVFLVVPFLVLLRMGWRILRGEDEFVAGGSMGHQMTSHAENRHTLRRLFGRLMHRSA